MEDQRRHQRIRFGSPPSIKIGYAGSTMRGTVENLSLSGIMVRTPQLLEVGKTFGCEFSVFGSPKIDVAAITISKVGAVSYTHLDVYKRQTPLRTQASRLSGSLSTP